MCGEIVYDYKGVFLLYPFVSNGNILLKWGHVKIVMKEAVVVS